MFLAAIHADREPMTYSEAVKDEGWRDACNMRYTYWEKLTHER